MKIANNLLPDKVKALRLIDNKTNESKWDIDMLSSELGELSSVNMDFDMGLFNFGTVDLEFYDVSNDGSQSASITSKNNANMIISIGRLKIPVDDPDRTLIEASKNISADVMADIVEMIIERLNNEILS